jgi:hypothetical protein
MDYLHFSTGTQSCSLSRIILSIFKRSSAHSQHPEATHILKFQLFYRLSSRTSRTISIYEHFIRNGLLSGKHHILSSPCTMLTTILVPVRASSWACFGENHTHFISVLMQRVPYFVRFYSWSPSALGLLLSVFVNTHPHLHCIDPRESRLLHINFYRIELTSMDVILYGRLGIEENIYMSDSEM